MASAAVARAAASWYGIFGETSSSVKGRPFPSIRTSTSSRPAEWKRASLAPKRGTITSVRHSCTDPCALRAPSRIQGDCGSLRENFLYLPVRVMFERSTETDTRHGEGGEGGGQSRDAEIRLSARSMPRARVTVRMESYSTGWFWAARLRFACCGSGGNSLETMS